MMISIVVPCFNEEKAIPLFYKELISVVVVMDYQYEIVFVDDGSTDKTKEVIKSLADKDDHVLFLSLSRNFGKESAIYAGICNAQGDLTVIMDADLQDPPAFLPEMIHILSTEDYDSVATRRVTRDGEPLIRSWFARRFYKIINRYSDADIMDGARDYRMMRRGMLDAVISMSEYNRFSKGIFGWVGFKTKWIDYENKERVAGETKWSFWKLFRYAIDGIISFSQAPLNFASWLGFFMTVVSFVTLVFIIFRKLLLGDPVAGWASTVCIIVFIGGVQLAVLGIIGQYLAKTYLETKQRPHYIIAESNKDSVRKIG